MGVQALQVLNRSGKWIDAPPIEGTFVINIADAMMRASSAYLSHPELLTQSVTHGSAGLSLLEALADRRCL